MTTELNAAVIGGGPAGLMAAQVLQSQGHEVHLFDAMPSVARKFLLAGKGGLNITHGEAADAFAGRFGERRAQVEPWLREFGPAALREWVHGLGIATFVGSSGRVFPADMKAAPLLRAWLHRLRHPVAGPAVRFHMRHRWSGWGSDGELLFATPQGEHGVRARAAVLALGGASWPRLGSTGAWVEPLRARGLRVAPLLAANCGFDVSTPLAGGGWRAGWSGHFASRHAGQPFKSVALAVHTAQGGFRRKGEFVATATGVEGSLVYAASALLRDEIARAGEATLLLDLLPDRTPERVLADVAHPRGSRSLSSHLKSRLGLDGIKAAVLHEVLDRTQMAQPELLAARIKALPLRLAAARPVEEAISTAGGVGFDELDAQLMLRRLPGVFCAGEMLDWEAPTGGYLLTACMASGRMAGQGAAQWLRAGDGGP